MTLPLPQESAFDKSLELLKSGMESPAQRHSEAGDIENKMPESQTAPKGGESRSRGCSGTSHSPTRIDGASSTVSDSNSTRRSRRSTSFRGSYELPSLHQKLRQGTSLYYYSRTTGTDAHQVTPIPLLCDVLKWSCKSLYYSKIQKYPQPVSCSARATLYKNLATGAGRDASDSSVTSPPELDSPMV